MCVLAAAQVKGGQANSNQLVFQIWHKEEGHKGEVFERLRAVLSNLTDLNNSFHRGMHPCAVIGFGVIVQVLREVAGNHIFGLGFSALGNQWTSLSVRYTYAVCVRDAETCCTAVVMYGLVRASFLCNGDFYVSVPAFPVLYCVLCYHIAGVL